MAPAMSGPTKCSADPDHGASSTCLPSSRVKVTAGSRAAAAMKSERATDLPAPGSPPSSRLRSGSPIETGFPSSSIPSESGSHSEPSGTGHGGAGTDKGSRKRIETWASEALAGSRTHPDLAGPDGGGQRLAGLVDHLGGEARRQAEAQPLAGRDRLGRFDPGDQTRGG